MRTEVGIYGTEEDLATFKKLTENSTTESLVEFDIHFYSDGRKMLEDIHKNEYKFDVFILDMEMKEFFGFDMAKQIKRLDIDSDIAFVSSHDEDVFESFDYNPIQFIRRHCLDIDMQKLINKICKDTLKKQENRLVIKSEDGVVLLNRDDILYCEMESRKINIYTTDNTSKRISKRISLTELLTKLGKEFFVKVHSGCIVNARHVNEYSYNNVIMDNGKIIEMSRGEFSNVKKALDCAQKEYIYNINKESQYEEYETGNMHSYVYAIFFVLDAELKR